MNPFEAQAGLDIYPRSRTQVGGATYFLARIERGEKVLGVVGDASGFEGERQGELFVAPRTAANAAALRAKITWLRPRRLGLQTSVGCGDRLGLATPGHVRAVRRADVSRPIFAQQSVRENQRTGRSPQEVMDDATWGVFQEGWPAPWGADADHLKTEADVERFVAAGYTFYTIDPGDHVDNAAHTNSPGVLEQKFARLPWKVLEETPEGLRERYLGREFPVESFTLAFDAETLLRAACKYGAALAHTMTLYRHLVALAGATELELEVSVDETESLTSPAEHYFIAAELRRLGVRWISLAPRYVGRFEKGVDYVGDLDLFEAEFSRHAAIARTLGPYKLSLHSGSDKFSIYPIVARETQGLVHLKTAGTSYLEALRATARMEPDLFRQILALAHERYPEDRASYHVSADPARVPQPHEVEDAQLPALLDHFDARQMLHVTFGSALDAHGDALKAVLSTHEEAHYTALEAHFLKHLRSFSCFS